MSAAVRTFSAPRLRRRGALAIVFLLAVALTPAAVPAPADAAPVRETGRLQGASRFATAVAIAQEEFPEGARAVYLARANSDKLVDAVAGGTLTDGPVLIVPSCGDVPEVVRSEIARLAPERVTALGGAAAVCEATLRQAAGGRPTDRLAGGDRYATATTISRAAFPNPAAVTRVYLARSDNIADAVAGGSLTRGPVLLVPRCGALPESVRAEITRVAPGEVVALGGSGAVCDAILDAAAAGRPRRRLAGLNRHATAVAIAREQFDRSTDTVYLARSDVFVDAVAGGSLSRGPVLTVPSCGHFPETVTREIARLAPASGPQRIVALGGTAAVCEASLTTAAAAPTGACRPSTQQFGYGEGVKGHPVTAAVRTGDQLVTVSRGTRPLLVSYFDLHTGEFLKDVGLPLGAGGWAIVEAGGAHYVGTYAPPVVYRVGPDGSVSTVADLTAREGGNGYIWDMAASPDGDKLYVGSWAGARVYEIDLTRTPPRLTVLARPDASRQYVRSLGVTDDAVFAGLGTPARLVRIGRTGADRGVVTDMTPPALADESMVYDLAVSDDRLVAGSDPDGWLATWPIAADGTVDETAGQVVRAHPADDTGDGVIHTTFDAGGAPLASTRSGDILREESPGVWVSRLRPVENEETRAIVDLPSGLVGVGGSGLIWREAAAAVGVAELKDTGAQLLAENGFSVTQYDGDPVVGGHWAVEWHDGRAPERVRVPGEAKKLLPDGGGVIAAVYPRGEIWRLSRNSDEPDDARLLATIGHEQIRPVAMRRDARTGAVLIGTAPEYGRLGGALSVLRGSELEVHRWTFGPGTVGGIDTFDGMAAVSTESQGGIGAPRIDEPARVALWDIERGETVWSVHPDAGERGYAGVAHTGTDVVAVSPFGRVDVLAAATGHKKWSFSIGTDRVWDVASIDGWVYVATDRGVKRFDPEIADVEVAGLTLRTLSMSVDETTCAIMVLNGREVSRIAG